MELNELAVEFLEKTIPYYAADPAWRELFSELLKLNNEERIGMLQRLNTVTGPMLALENNEQFSTAMDFIRLSLEEPLNLRMMVKMIDHENLRVQKMCKQEVIA